MVPFFHVATLVFVLYFRRFFKSTKGFCSPQEVYGGATGLLFKKSFHMLHVRLIFTTHGKIFRAFVYIDV